MPPSAAPSGSLPTAPALSFAGPSSRGMTSSVSPSIPSTLTLYPASIGLPGGVDARPPERALDEDLAGRIERRPDRGDRAEQLLLPGRHRSVAVPAAPLRPTKTVPRPSTPATPITRAGLTSTCVAVGVEDQQAAADQRRDPGHPEQAAGRQVGLGDDQHETQRRAARPRPRRRELDRADQPEHEGERADQPGDDRPRRRRLERDPEHPTAAAGRRCWDRPGSAGSA